MRTETPWPRVSHSRAVILAALALATACSPAHAPPAVPAPTYVVKRSEIGPGIFATTEAASLIDGRRPTLTFACGPDAPPSIQIDLVQAPASPPPLAGVFGSLQIGDAPPEAVELSWTGSGGDWMPRNGPAEPRLVAAMLEARRVTLDPPAAFAPAGPITWDLSGFGGDFARVAEACKSPPT